ncbi:AFR108Wp [Eremothecium gossypii ATCC 10895]|uniref:pH-response regulator protein palF/RIM8 n=1 Tax=Eremothecium gossypii (strain ATCC 10895 / CBS 109.51 / FGSC 9923 / NRRL Y-1056) TaxID=284811 RepID=PALF_EREGS|nr:AFR108Wp [Eremothecium gossypii ATCC 10895]Q754G2.1 RecName: Full=pH-response regulator protein palF/RIM8 [Eremothecium gossypii ATCC 10895]AAS53479.1 AFR108Wp [Eremothecium gossypii ATCC 10895]AEY97791.1 FAFR108Wp [Eremothecium gossypii FDAG1]
MHMRLFSKFKLHGSSAASEEVFGGKFSYTSAVADFYIELGDAHKIWKPRDVVTGEVVLTLRKPLRGVSLRMSLEGNLRVQTGSGATSRLKFQRTLFSKSSMIYGVEQPEDAEQEGHGLTRGDHRFPFRMRVPSKNIYTSIAFEKGSISYAVGCVLETRSGAQRLSSCSRQISVLVPVDVSLLPKLRPKTVVLQSPQLLRSAKANYPEHDTASSLTKRTTASANSNSSVTTVCSSKTVTISVDLPESGYVIGDTIRIKVHIQHYKEYRNSAGLIATLVRICRVHSTGTDDPMETFRKDICQCVAPLYVEPETHTCSVGMNLNVPLDAFPTLVVPNQGFTFQYYIEVLANLSSKNIVYTESNRVIGGSGMADIPMPGSKLHPVKKISMLPLKLQGPLGKQDTNIDESLIFFQDMVNVDKLKRLRNVTGTSIEVVIGTHRNNSVQQARQSCPGSPVGGSDSTMMSEQSAAGTSLPSSVLDIYDQLANRLSSSVGDQLLRYGMSPDSGPHSANDELPRYTPNVDYMVTEDKRELEQRKLKELESEPSVEEEQ